MGVFETNSNDTECAHRIVRRVEVRKTINKSHSSNARTCLPNRLQAFPIHIASIGVYLRPPRHIRSARLLVHRAETRATVEVQPLVKLFQDCKPK